MTPHDACFVCAKLAKRRSLFSRSLFNHMSWSSVHKYAQPEASKPGSSKDTISIKKRWNYLAITYNVSNKPPSQDRNQTDSRAFHEEYGFILYSYFVTSKRTLNLSFFTLKFLRKFALPKGSVCIGTIRGGN